MTLAIFYKLLAIALTVALGWAAERWRWLRSSEAVAVLNHITFYLFIPALLFRTTARIDMGHLPWRTLAAYFGPTLLLLGVLVLALRGRGGAAAPGVRGISATFGNSVQLGIPLATAMFGEAGLGLHLTLVSLHALVLMSAVTVLTELALAREQAARSGSASLGATLRSTVRNTVIHPVVLPVLAGLAWGATGWPLPGAVDEVLLTLSTAAVPLCLLLIGMSLAHYGLAGALGPALALSTAKLLLLPALVLACAHLLFGLGGLPLQVLVMMAALPVGNNALIFAQRYGTLQAEATAAIVISTLAYCATAPAWLALLAAWAL